MDGLSLFNIGFRCENISIALNAYKSNGQISRNALEDSLQIISDCFKVKGAIAENLSSTKYEPSQLYTLIFRMFGGKTFDQIFAELNKLKNIIDDVSAKKSNVDVDSATNFFESLADMCLASRNNNRSFGTLTLS